MEWPNCSAMTLTDVDNKKHYACLKYQIKVPIKDINTSIQNEFGVWYKMGTFQKLIEHDFAMNTTKEIMERTDTLQLSHMMTTPNIPVTTPAGCPSPFVQIASGCYMHYHDPANPDGVIHEEGQGICEAEGTAVGKYGTLANFDSITVSMRVAKSCSK